MMKLKLLIFLPLLSCALFQGDKEFSENDYPIQSPKEFESFLSQKSNEFVKTSRRKIIMPYRSERRYLHSLVKEIQIPNKKFFGESKDIDFIIVKSKAPYYLSVPPNKIVLSTALFGEYIENENLLASIITYELIRLENLLYPRKISAPIGVISEKDLIKHTQVSRTTRSQIHKWSHRILKRTIFDESTYLLWMQIVMRNTKNFEVHYSGEEKVLSEERDFKAFIIQDEKKSGTTFEQTKPERRVPRVFYSMLERFKNAR